MKRGREHIEPTKSPLLDPDNGVSPILKGQSTRIEDSDSDDEVIFSTQANKKRKMAADEALRIWISEEFDKKTR